MVVKSYPIRLVRLLYSSFNQRNIEAVCDFELYYGLFCGSQNILHFMSLICGELARLPGVPQVDEDEDGGGDGTPNEESMKAFVAAIGVEDSYSDADVLLENLLTELLCRRIESKTCYQQSITSKDFAKAPFCNKDIATLISHGLPSIHIDDKDFADLIIDALGSTSIESYSHHQSLFSERNLDQQTIESIRELVISLCEEYDERWNLYLVRFDCLLKVFLGSSNLKETKELQTLLEVINKWRNGSYARFRQFNIYDVYRATRNILKIDRVSCNNGVKDVMELYATQAKLGAEGTYQSFIKKIHIPEPPNRGGLPDGFSTRKFYAKFKRH